MVVGGGGNVCCEKKKIWGCLCIVAFEVLNGARGVARGGTGLGLEPPRAARYTARDLGDDPGRGGCDWNPRGFRSTPRGAAQLRPPHAPRATLRCPAKGHAVDLERVGKGRRAPMSTPSGILNRISASLIVSSRSITLVY